MQVPVPAAPPKWDATDVVAALAKDGIKGLLNSDGNASDSSDSDNTHWAHGTGRNSATTGRETKRRKRTESKAKPSSPVAQAMEAGVKITVTGVLRDIATWNYGTIGPSGQHKVTVTMALTGVDRWAGSLRARCSIDVEKLEPFMRRAETPIVASGVLRCNQNTMWTLDATSLSPVSGATVEPARPSQTVHDILGRPWHEHHRSVAHVAVITTATGAAVADMAAVMADSCGIKFVVHHACVQGAAAPHSIACATENALKTHPDAIVWTRGGGSRDDLSVFSDPCVLTAVDEARRRGVLCVAAIGHARDWLGIHQRVHYAATTPTAASLWLQTKAPAQRLAFLVQRSRRLLDHAVTKGHAAVATARRRADSVENAVAAAGWQIVMYARGISHGVGTMAAAQEICEPPVSPVCPT
jgi:hypothetical protein